MPRRASTPNEPRRDPSRDVAPVRHARDTRRRTRLVRSLAVVGVALAVIVVSGVALAAFEVWRLGGAVAANAVDISNGDSGGDDTTSVQAAADPAISAMDGGFSVLLVGADNSTDQGESYGERDATLNDVNILVHVSADHRSAVVMSIPRDLVVAQPECTDATTGAVSDAVSAQAVNTAYSRGGLGCVVATVSQLTGLEIPYAGLISFAGTVAMADAVGGVPVCLAEAIDDPYSGLDLPAGTSTVSGAQALAYLRSRHGVGDGSDLSRISSQQAYMSSLLRVMKSSATLTNLPALLALAEAAASNISLSTSLANVQTMVSMAMALADVDLSNVVFVQYPSVEDPDDSAKVVPDEALAAALLQKVATDSPISLASGSLGTGVTAADGSADAGSSAPADAGDATTDVSTDGATDAPTAAATDPDVIAGLTGQTASEQTCSVAFGD